MTPSLFLVAYLVVGCVAAAWLFSEGRAIASLSPPVSAVLLVPLWPFLLPLFTSPSEPVGAGRGDALSDNASSLYVAFEAAHHALGRAVEREGLRAFVEELGRQQQRLTDLRAAARQAPEGARDGLERMRLETQRRLDEGLSLLDALTAELTLLRFAQREDDVPERTEQMEDLLTRMRALGTLDAAP